MQHVTYADKSLLVGDDAAETLIRYAAALGRKQSSDYVRLTAISGDGDEVTATFLLSASAPLMIESAHSSLPEPDNTAAVQHMKQKISALEHSPSGRALNPADNDAIDVDYGGLSQS